MSISDDITKNLKDIDDGVSFMGDQIILTDAAKEPYDSAIKKLDEPLLPELNAVNQTLADVQEAYEARLTAGCRTDLFWRLTGINTATASPPGGVATAHYKLIVDRLTLTGYGLTTGLQGGSLTVIGGSGGITTYAAGNTNEFGYIKDHLHGLKYYNEPVTEDVGDTTVGNFIGTVGSGSTVLAVMTPYTDHLIDDFEVSQLITCSKSGVFNGTNNTIVGFGSVVTTLSGINSTGIGTTSVPTILLETATIGIASAPESDGTFVDFQVVDDPAGITTYSDYAIPFTANPFSPQTLGVVKEDTLGIGVSVYYDNTGFSSSPQSWKPEFAISGYAPTIPDVVEPAVGAGPIYYKVGFTIQPNQGYGTTKVVTDLSTGLYNSLSACSTQEAALTAAINARDAKESGFPSASFTATLEASTALRAERKKSYELKIWGMRTSIGDMVTEKDRYNTLADYVDTEGVDL